MLLAQGLTLTLSLWDRQILKGLPESLIRNRIAIVLAQILSRTLLSQQHDGSWGSGSCEVTAYGILTLKVLAPIPFLRSVASEISAAIVAGRQNLLGNRGRWADLSYVWIEKVSYGSAVLAQTYCFAALHDSNPTHAWSSALIALFDLPMDTQGTKFAKFLSRLPLFSHLDKDNPTLKLSILEGYLLLPRLRAARLDIFPRTNMAEDKWLEYVPLTWTCCSYLNAPVETGLLIEMMHLSMLNYQADEYMEAVVGACNDPDKVRAIIRKLCAEPATCSSPLLPRKRSHPCDDGEDELAGIEKVLAKYVNHILAHPSVLRAPARTRTRLRQELATFLSAHVIQNADNALLAKQRHLEKSRDEAGSPQPFAAARSSFYQWVRSVSADHTSGPFAWIFYECLIGRAGVETWAGARKGYIAEELGRRLSTMCRMYNDYGSVARDRAEMNVNSLDFPEFYASTVAAGSGGDLGGTEQETARKADLMYLAEYERGCMNEAIELLEGMVDPGVTNRVRLFVNVTDMYGQIYVARDIASRMK